MRTPINFLLTRSKRVAISKITQCLLFITLLLLSLNVFSKSLASNFVVPIITSNTTVTGVVGVAFTYTIVASNIPTGFSVSSLPAGLSINTTTGIISGTPTAAGNFLDTITASNSDGSVSQTLAITILSAWGLLGNSGTNPASNFIGTSDNQDVVFKRNNLKAGLLGSNTAFGVVSLFTDTTGFNNTTIGNASLYYNNGSYNTAVGSSSLYYNSTGTNNTAEGFSSLFNNRSASFNTAFGQACLYSNTTGAYNTAAGGSALYNNRSAYYNNAFGYQSLYKNIGSGNTGIGHQSLYTDSIGNYNTAIGYKADVITASTSFAIALGYNATALANQLALSDSIHTIKAKGLPTGRGYVLTDAAGNGNLSLQPAPTITFGGTTNYITKFTPNGASIGSSQIFDDGSLVAIGTISSASTTGYKFAVNGAAIFTKAVIKLYATWPDFVFDEKYNLPSLIETKKYIDQNKHLPGLPSATEVEKNGIDVGITQTVLLQKVEELTLYIINQDKELEQQKDQIDEQNIQLVKIQQELDELKRLIKKEQ
jgi:hypothetical protein